jgi:hypothetical protein
VVGGRSTMVGVSRRGLIPALATSGACSRPPRVQTTDGRSPTALALSPHRAPLTMRDAGCADEGAELDEGLVVHVGDGAGAGEEPLGDRPGHPSAGGGAGVVAGSKMARHGNGHAFRMERSK